MRRIRLFRVLLPAALLVFVALVVVSLNQRPAVHGTPAIGSSQAERFAKGIDVVSLKGEQAALDAKAALVEPQGDGGYHLETISRLGIARRGRGPLLVQAELADVEGPASQRRMRIRERVVVRDPEEGLLLTLPMLDVDEVAGEARAEGEVRFEGPTSRGRASRLIYGLHGQPTVLFEPLLEQIAGGTLRADQARLLDGLNEIEFRGDVVGERGPERFSSGRLQLWRGPEGQLRRAEGREQVRSRALVAEDTLADLAAERFEARWDSTGAVEQLTLDGMATLVREGDSLAAGLIECIRQPEAGWEITASETVYLNGEFGGAPAWLRAETLRARLDSALELHAADADGGVRFETAATRAEAERAELETTQGEAPEVRLFAADGHKARLAREQTRIAAEWIATDLHGRRLAARRRVEATLLPASEDAASASTVGGLFRAGEAVHFVAGELIGEPALGRLEFRDAVRGWQGERNLSADQVEIDQRGGTLRAAGSVTTRIPRDGREDVRNEDDYIQVAADRLEYDDESGLAVYRGEVRVVLVEGWLEADTVEVMLAEGGKKGGIRQLRADGDVRVEFRRSDEQGRPQLVAGAADRLTYRPDERIVRMFGDERPASVRRLGAGGASTSGRVLRYRLDVGTLEVEPGERAPARIRGS